MAKMRSSPAYTLSLILHILLICIIIYSPAPPKAPQPVEILYTPKDPPQQEKQFVRDTQTPDDFKDDSLSKLASLKKRRVKKQTQAEKSGLTQNRAQNKRQASSEKQKSKGQNTPTKSVIAPRFAPTFSDDSEKAKQFPKGLSTNSQWLNQVAVGDFTALNTDRHLFYTFYSRVEEQIANYWYPHIRDAISQFHPRELKSRKWETQLEIIVDGKGRYRDVVLYKASGSSYLDQIALDSAKNGAPFPNPPEEKIDNDGLVRLKFSFVVGSPY
jgi:TonB family protein